MDTFTHGITGALIGKAFFAGDNNTAPDRAAAGRVVTYAATLGAIFPDIDFFFGPIARNDLAVIEWHRGVTHSLVCLPVFAVLLASLTRWYTRRRGWHAPSWATLAGIYAAVLASHILLDLITSFGTMIWSPLNHARATWDLVFILDFTLTGIALLPQLAAWAYGDREKSALRALRLWSAFTLAAIALVWLTRAVGFAFSPWVIVAVSVLLAALFFLPAWRGWGFRVRRSAWCRAGVYAAAAYLLLCAAAHHAALRRVEQFAAAKGLRVEHLGAMPMPPSIARWDGLVRTPDGVYEIRFNLLHPQPPAELVAYSFFPDAEPNPYLEAARQLPRVKTYLWFARFPVYRFAQRRGRDVVEISDLRFFSRRGRPAPFTFRVTFDGQGGVLEQGWVTTVP